jgi:transcriptional regulator with XRE-family HTH domain
MRSAPWRFSLIPRASASRSMETSRLSRAISCSGMRAINPTFRVSGLFLKSCQEECVLPVVLSRQAVSEVRLKLHLMKKATIRKPPLDFHGETLGQRLARLRTQRGYTQVEFAGKVGITQVLVSSYETDRRQFSVEMAIRFALALDISTDELLHPKAKKISSKKTSRRVMRRVEEIEKLPPYEQRALLTTIDKFIATAQDS